LSLQVKGATGTVRVMLIADPDGISVKGDKLTFSCGAQKPRGG
jgi:hypothetical protein